MNDKFSIELFGDLDFEGMVVNVCYNMQTVAAINYDKGVDNMEVALFPDGAFSGLIFPLADFLEVLEKAKQLALRCAEEDRIQKENEGLQT